MPRRIEAADLSDHASVKAMQLLQRIRAVDSEVPFGVACQRALRLAYLEDQERHRRPR